MEGRKMGLPRPCWWPEPITAAQASAFVPETIEVEEGYLLGGPEADDRRMQLLGLLLRNCGLDRAVRLADPTLWKEALDRWQLYGGYNFDHDLYTVPEGE